MAYTKGTLEHGSDVLLPKTTLDQLYTSDGATAVVESGTNTIKQDYLPVSGQEKGIVKVNTSWDTYGVSLAISNGTVSVAGRYASASQFGAVKVNTTSTNGVSLAVSNGTVSASAQYATTNAFGVVMVPGGSTNGVALNISDGRLYASGVLAQNNAFGVVKAGNYVTINDGVVSVDLAETDDEGGTAGAVYVNPTNGGRGITLDVSNGKLDVSVNAASKYGFGTVKIGDNINVVFEGEDDDGTISVPLAGTNVAGVVQLASSIGSSTTNVVTEVLAKNAFDNLQGQISNITGTTVANLQSQISDITGTTVANLQGQINDITGTTVSNLQGQISNITGTTVAALQGQITDITGTTVANLQNQINGKQDTLSAGAGIELNGNAISTTSVMKVMTTEQRTAITPEAGQVIYDSTLGQLFLGDGFTPGGTIVGGGGGGGSVTPGYRLTDDGTYLNFNPVMPIVDTTGSNTVTLAPDNAYKIVATGSAVTLNANAPAAGSWGLEGHAEIFVAGAGYVVAGANVYLLNALEPDAVNNCTLRFHDGRCYISVEDHAYGYIVTLSGGTHTDENGTLTYGITSASDNYITFDISLNGQTIQLSGGTTTSVANGEKHIVGNGFTSTTLTGAVDCGDSGFTAANLALLDVGIVGGVMTLGDVAIPSGSTVAVSGGGLAVEKVMGAGSDSVIDLGNTKLSIATGGRVFIGDCTIKGGSAGAGGVATVASGSLTLSGCNMTGNTSPYGAVAYINYDAVLTLDHCSAYGNTGQRGDFFLLSGTMVVKDSYISGNIYNSKTNTLTFGGNCSFGGDIKNPYTSSLLNVVISSGATLDFTGNSNATPINPGGTINYGSNVTVINSGGTPVLLNSGTAGSCSVIHNDGTIE